MIHFNSIHFSGCSKENRLMVNDSSMILTELWQTGADSTHEIHDVSSIHLLNSFAKFCKYIPFANLPHLFPTCSTNQLQSRQSVVMLLALQTVALIFNEIDKNISFSCVIVFPLPLRRHLKYVFYNKWQRPKLSYFLSHFLDEEKKIPASSELIHGFSSMFSRLLTISDSLV